MARKDSFNKTWASNPAQFEKPGDALIERGWAGGASEDPPEAKWENWWHNRLDEALLEIQNSGALAWFSDAKYTKGALVNYGGRNWVALSANSNISPNGSLDNGIWLEVEYSKSDFLKKSQNGADIPNKSEFVKNLGLAETVERAGKSLLRENYLSEYTTATEKSILRKNIGAVSDSGGDYQGTFTFSEIATIAKERNSVQLVSANAGAPTGTLCSYMKANWYDNCVAFGAVRGGTVDLIGAGIDINSKRALTIYKNGIVVPADYGNFDARYDNIPVGVPLPYPHRYTPPGYLTCNGQTFDKSLYPKLAEAYPAGRVPDLRGEFIRGWDDSRGVDPGRVCGTWQADSTKKIQLAAGYGNENSYLWTYQGAPGGLKYPIGRDAIGNATATSIASNTSGHETRPRNIAFNYIVRAA